MTLTRKRKIAARRTNERYIYIYIYRKIVPVVRLGGLAPARPNILRTGNIISPRARVKAKPGKISETSIKMK